MIKHQLFLTLLLASLSQNVLISQFPGPVGTYGCDAIHKDSSVIVDWADSVVIERGFKNIKDITLGYAEFGESVNANGKADNQVVSLGDGGSAMYYLKTPVTNGAGPDFAIFENALNDEFLELAYVGVSSDGVNFFRFPDISLTSKSPQTGPFGLTDTKKISFLAGKYRAGYGTPFDLDSLTDNFFLNKKGITHIRVVDVVGSVDPSYGTFDSKGNLINDPFPTPFSSGGFDLDAAGLINLNTSNLLYTSEKYIIYPTLVNDILNIELGDDRPELQIFDAMGRSVNDVLIRNKAKIIQVNVSSINKGLYFIRLLNINADEIFFFRFYKL